MASGGDIANLALGHLGDNATVASLDPPEGSAQAEHCARFYPIARDTLLEMHPWRFALRRTLLAELTNEFDQWEYSYAKPNDCLRALAVMSPEVTDDLAASGLVTPQPFVCEVDSDGADVILTNQEDAMLRYVARVEDTTKFSPLFVVTVSWFMSSMLAGPIIKGDAGAAEAKRCLEMMRMFLSKAIESDANERRTVLTHTPSWMQGR